MPVRFASATIASCIAALSPPSSANPEEMITAFFTPSGRTLFERTEHRARGNDDDRKIDRRTDIGDRFVAMKAVDLAHSSD